MVGAENTEELLLGYSPDGMFEIVLRPVRGPRRPPRPMTCPQPPPPPQPPQPPRPPRTPSPLPRPIPQTEGRTVWIPVSDGNYITAEGNVCTVRSDFTGSVTVSTDSEGRRTVREVGRRIIKEEIKKEVPEDPPTLPPFTSLMRGPRTPPPRPPLPVSVSGDSSPWLSTRNPPPRPPPPRWVSPRAQRPETPTPRDPPPPYQGIVVTETPQSPPPPYGEVLVESQAIGVRVTPRTSQGIYPELPPTPPASPAVLPSAPPMDPGYGGSSGLSGSSDSGSDRGIVRPHSDSPFQSDVRARGLLSREEEQLIDLEAISCLVDFASRNVTTPTTPAAAPRPERPPPVISSRRAPSSLVVRPRALRRSTPPPAALGAPPHPAGRETPMEEDQDLPDIPDTPASPAISDITVLSTISSGGDSEGPMNYSTDEEDMMLEYEYADPFEGEGAHSTTPPPTCTHPAHEVCVPPAWGEKIPGAQVYCRCVLCHQDDLHHAIRCIQCQNPPGCCKCIWNYMRSRYNSGCPLCRAGDPLEENPLGASQYRRRCVPRPREEVTYYRRGRNVARRGRGRGLLCGISRSRGRGTTPSSGTTPGSSSDQQPQQQQQPAQRARRGRRGRGRATTIEEDQQKKED